MIQQTKLTSRELELLQYISTGMKYKEIAVIECISIDTVKKHLSNAYKKLEARNRTEALIKVNMTSI